MSVATEQLSLGQFVHEALPIPKPGSDEEVRQAFCMALRRFSGEVLAPLVKNDYESRARASSCVTAVEEVMSSSVLFKTWSAIRRSTQELLWDTVERGLTAWKSENPKLIRSKLVPKAGQEIYPDYLRPIDIHCMPGSYIGQPDETFEAGARYDRGVYLYTMGQLGPKNDSLASSVLNFLKDSRPDFAPEKTLDMGCTTGARTIPYSTYFNGSVVGIDVSPSLMAYAQWRASALGHDAVSFQVADARDTGFASKSFDLVVSHILLHEMPPTSVVEVLSETKRIVKKGGIAIHADYGQYGDMDPFSRFMIAWDTFGNNEPYWSAFRKLDLMELAGKAGMAPDEVRIERVPVGRKLQTGSSATSGFLTLLVYEPSA